jgi:hypothetical protein
MDVQKRIVNRITNECYNRYAGPILLIGDIQDE